MEEQDYIIDDIFFNTEKNKKKINSGRKGKGGERQLASIFNKRFATLLENNPTWGKFTRSVGSGNRWGQVALSSNATNFYSGDIICENFKFVIEAKTGYDDIDLFTAFDGNKEIDAFLKQVSDDAKRCNKKPMLVWKKNRKDHIVFICEKIDCSKLTYKMFYREWTVVSLNALLESNADDFFYNMSNQN
jgi:hypothetical protein